MRTLRLARHGRSSTTSAKVRRTIHGATTVLVVLASALVAANQAGADSGPVVTPSTSSMTVTAGIAFNVTWTVVAGASITYNHLNVYEPNGNELPSECSDSTLISGAASNGTYQATCTLPNGLANANYTTSIQVDDSLGNIVDSAGPMLTLTGSTVLLPPVVTSLSTLSLVKANGAVESATTTVSCAQSVCAIKGTLYEIVSAKVNSPSANGDEELANAKDHAMHARKLTTRKIVIGRGRATVKRGWKSVLRLVLNPNGVRQLRSASATRPVKGDQLVLRVRNGRTVTRSVIIR